MGKLVHAERKLASLQVENQSLREIIRSLEQQVELQQQAASKRGSEEANSSQPPLGHPPALASAPAAVQAEAVGLTQEQLHILEEVRKGTSAVVSTQGGNKGKWFTVYERVVKAVWPQRGLTLPKNKKEWDAAFTILAAEINDMTPLNSRATAMLTYDEGQAGAVSQAHSTTYRNRGSGPSQASNPTPLLP